MTALAASVALLLTLANAEAPAAPAWPPPEAPAPVSPTPAARPTDLKLELKGGVAAGVATPLWGGAEVEIQRRFARRLILGASAEVTAGSNEEGAPLGGYRLNAVFGFDWFDSHHVSWKWLLHGGVMSVAWVPSPNVGVDSKLSFTPVYFDHFRWSLGWDGTAEFPWRVSTSVWTEFVVPFDVFSIGLRGSVGLHGGVDLFGVGGGLGLQLGWRF